MVEIPDSLRSLFTVTLKEINGEYIVEIPKEELEHEAITAGKTYRIAVLGSAESKEETQNSQSSTDRRQTSQAQSPPVEEGEIREVTIETIGDQGDGIAKVERGYVVIVPDAQPGEHPTIEIEDTRENVAFATVTDSDPRASR